MTALKEYPAAYPATASFSGHAVQQRGGFVDVARLDILNEDITFAREAGVLPEDLVPHLLSRGWNLRDLKKAPCEETARLAEAYERKLDRLDMAQVGAGIACFLFCCGFALITLASDTTLPGV